MFNEKDESYSRGAGELDQDVAVAIYPILDLYAKSYKIRDIEYVAQRAILDWALGQLMIKRSEV